MERGDYMRIWGKIWKDNRLLKDITYERPDDDTRTHIIFDSLTFFCHEFDLAVPLWLDKNIKEFKRDKKTRFRQDNFNEQIEFDFLELEVLDEYEES